MQAAKMPAAEVAQAGHKAFRQNRCINIPGLKNRLMMQLVRMAPRSIIRRAVARYNQVKQGTVIKK
jgi:short-subunit dehydrogenase